MRKGLLSRVMPRRRARASMVELAGEIWAASPSRVEEFFAELMVRLEDLPVVFGGFAAADALEEERSGYEVIDGVAVFSLAGDLFPEVPWWYEWLGWAATSVVELREQLAVALDDSAVSSVLFVVDSPGGLMQGIAALADAVFAARERKPIRAHVVGHCCSAAYYIASQTERLTTDRDGIIGSIGTVITIYDRSKMFEEAGIKVLPVRSSPLKAAPMPGEPVKAEHVVPYRELVEEAAALFRAAVSRGRGFTDEQWEALGDPGRVWSASRSLELALIDEVTTIDAVLAAAAETTPAPSGTPAPAGAHHQEDSMDLKELEALRAEIAALKAKTEEQEKAQKAAEAKAEAEAAKRAALEASVEGVKADRKKAMIEAAVTAGNVNATNKEAIERYAAHVDAEELAGFLKALPQATRSAAQGATGKQKDDGLDEAEAEDLREIAAKFGVGLDAFKGVTAQTRRDGFDLAGYALEQEKARRKGYAGAKGTVRVVDGGKQD